jgi:hypothetical protein
MVGIVRPEGLPRETSKLVLPRRIELRTSALPRMRSTTELRQHGFRIIRAYEESVWTGQGWRGYCSHMAKSDPEKLAAALRENLRKRKEQARIHHPEPSHGTDEEGDLPLGERGAGGDQPS